MKYIQVLNGLQNTLNTKRDKKTPEKMVYFLKLLKNDFGQEVSTKFLRGLLIEKTPREKTKRISYLLRRANLNTERRQKFFSEWVFSKYQTEITIYAHSKKTKVYNSSFELSENEQEILNQIQEVEDKNGVALYPKPLKDLEERQHRRDIINKEGGVIVKDCYKQGIGREGKANNKEILKFILV